MCADEFLYSGLIKMQELDTPGYVPYVCNRTHHNLHKVVSLIFNPTTTYPFMFFNFTDITFSLVTDEVLFTGLIEMQELDAS